MGFLAMFTFQLDSTGECCRYPIAVMGVVDMFEHNFLWNKQLWHIQKIFHQFNKRFPEFDILSGSCCCIRDFFPNTLMLLFYVHAMDKIIPVSIAFIIYISRSIRVEALCFLTVSQWKICFLIIESFSVLLYKVTIFR